MSIDTKSEGGDVAIVTRKMCFEEDIGPSPTDSTSTCETSDSCHVVGTKRLNTSGNRKRDESRRFRSMIASVYRTLFSLVAISNMAAAVTQLATQFHSSNPPLSDFATAAAANITVAILIRQGYVINILYGACRLIPRSAPLKLRCRFAYIYEFGGIHSGCAMCATLWFLVLTAYLTKQFINGMMRDAVVLSLDYFLAVFLIGIVITAYPRFRFLYHNIFENVHRFAGWSTLVIFWVELVFFARTIASNNETSLGHELTALPSFWLLIIASAHTIYPWIFLRRIRVRPEKLSKHAIRLYHDENVSRFRGFAISDAPLREWHAFASVPAKNGESGGSLIISNAGDWTRKTINNPRPYYYVRGIPVAGVLTMTTIFNRIVIVTTGSGIGPCLAVMLDLPPSACRIVWSTPAPVETFGRSIVDDVRAVDGGAIIHDTRKLGRPDLVQMAYEAYSGSHAEAVFCISNKHVTGKLLRGLRARGVNAYGPIWDS